MLTYDTEEIDFPAAFEHCKQKYFTSNSILYHESDLVDKVYLIRQGRVKLLSYLPNGRARIVRLLSKNHYIGLEGLFGTFYKHTAIAVEHVDVTYIGINRLRQLETNNPEQYCQIVKKGYEQVTQADKWILDFSTGGIRSRVARLVDHLRQLEYGNTSNQVELLTVNEMADMLGVTQESVSRVLAGFKRDDILSRVNDCDYNLYKINYQQLFVETQN